MNYRFAYLIAACLALAAGPRAGASAFPARPAVPDVDILVNGAAQSRYAHDGRWYIEALKGREYSIRLRNPFAVRVAVALSVDGLNTIDARETTANDARKWVLGPYETITISGWQTSQTVARRFEFTTEERSYGQALGKTTNLGVISAVFFKERVSITANESVTESMAAPAAGARNKAKDEYAATGMGRDTRHPVEEVWLDLESAPAHTMNIRYEFRPQLVRLGILPAGATVDPLQRREGAHGFTPGFCPEPPRSR